jgi:peptidoglycan/xylan/chitin deacetylase (PgdA/CDA1 family)
MYHHVSADREVTPRGFEEHLLLLKREGFRTLTLSEFHAHLSGARPVQGRAAVITFDDGYLDNWVCAYPLLKKHGLRAVVSVVTERAELARDAMRPRMDAGAASPDTRKDERGPEGFLSWRELKAMTDSGVFEVASHTHTHRDFQRERPYADLRQELIESRRLIEERLGVWTGAVFWPWGDCEREWSKTAAEAGYRMAFTTRAGANAPGLDPFDIRRFKVRGDSTRGLALKLWLYRHTRLGDCYARVHALTNPSRGSPGSGAR